MTAAHLFTATAQEGDDLSKEISSYEDCIKHLPPIVCDAMGYPPAATPTGGHTPTVVAALSPLPTTVDFKADGTQWHQFTVTASRDPPADNGSAITAYCETQISPLTRHA